MREIAIFTHNKRVKKQARLLGFRPLLELPKTLVKVRTKRDEEFAAKTAVRYGLVCVECDDWKIIPLENLIARCRGKGKVIAVVKSSDEAKLALQTMEFGADGVLLKTEDEKEMGKMAGLMKAVLVLGRGSLKKAVVTRTVPLGLGERACIDTCTTMKRGEGMLVGSSSKGMLLVQAEVEENELAAPRPFRVNTGAIALYTSVPGDKTAYLWELEAGASALIVDRRGDAKETIVVRSKTEVRPLILVEAEWKGKKAVAILQNAETIRVVTDKGSKEVTKLKAGDTVMAHFEERARHFGMPLEEETIVEK